MNELSLFSGAGGGLLGTKLLGWRHVGYVECSEYCQRVIAQRIADGFLAEAPIFGDVREFVQSGAAKQYRGIADVVTGGFPCQPFSLAGKQQGEQDERNMWPATAAVIRDVQPQTVLLENVPGLVSCGYIGTVLTDLAALGYVGRWGILGASDVGAPHMRKRLWIVGHAHRSSESTCAVNDEASELPKSFTDSVRIGCRSGWQGRTTAPGQVREATRADVSDASSEGLERQQQQSGAEAEHAAVSGSCWWETEPGMGRVAHGVADRVDRLKALGNGQVPAVVAEAWRLLS